MKFLGRNWFVAVICGAVFLFVLFPYLFQGKLIRGDSADGVIAYMSFLEQSFKKGESPFWNPYGAGGFPSFVSYSFPYNPLNLLLYLAPALFVHHWGLWLVLATSLFLMILLVRELGGGLIAGFIAGLSFLIAMMLYENNVYSAVAFAFQPFLFWLILKLVKTEKRSLSILYIAILALALAFVWLSAGSNYQFTVYTVITAFVWLIYWANHHKRKFFPLALKLTLGCAFGTAIGILGILPALTILGNLSLREGGLSFEYVTSTAPVRWSDIVLFVNPFFEGRSAETFLYMGLLPLIFLIASFFVKNVPHKKLFIFLFLIPLAIAFYKSPLLWAIQQLPILSYFRHPSRWMIVGSFGASILAGLGGERILARVKEKVKISDRKWLLIVALVIISIVIDYRIVWQKKFAIESPKAEFLINNSSPKQLKELIQTREAGRVLSVLPDDSVSVFYWALTGQGPPRDADLKAKIDAAYLHPNDQLFYGIETIELTDNLPLRMGRYLSLVGARISGGDYGESNLIKYPGMPIDRLSLLKQRSSLLNFLGVRYLLSGFDLREVGFDYQNLGRVRVEGVKEAGYAFGVNVYENTGAKPLAYFSKITDFTQNADQSYDTFKANDFRGVFVECADCGSITEAGGKIEILEKTNGRAILHSESDGVRFLIFSQNYIPGWGAWIDSVETEIFRVNAAFMGIFVPTGEHKIRFDFRYSELLNPKFYFNE
ncbi:MAG: YfhO family protein [Candidatus Harrisonbacteria bacterium]|nr:YfhO family protein [Candidatus Harrisonbacteria bacterium]